MTQGPVFGNVCLSGFPYIYVTQVNSKPFGGNQASYIDDVSCTRPKNSHFLQHCNEISSGL